MHKLARLTPLGRRHMVQRLAAGARVRDLAAAIDLSTTTVRRWWRRYQAEGEAGPAHRPSPPHPPPPAPPPPPPAPIPPAPPLGRPAPPPVQRYERAVPGELVHLDIKKLGRFQRVGHRIHGDHTRRTPRAGYDYLHIAIDDRTRLAYAALLPDQTAASAAAFLTGVQRWFAARGVRIQALLTDNGSAYVGHVFGALCRQLGIRHHRTRPYSPQTNGKAERFIRTCLAEWAYVRAYPTSGARASALPAFLRYYNEDRFHMGINGRTPMQRLAGQQ